MSYCQTTVSIIGYYESKNDRFIYNSISLNSDSTCFIYSSCECGDETFTKAKWEINGNILKLVCLPDSAYSIYPKVDYVYGNTETDSVAIYFTDYFNQPIEATVLGFIRGDTTSFNPERIPLDPQGMVMLPKQNYYGFMMAYEEHRYYKKGEAIGHYFEDKKLAAIKFHSEFGQAGYDRQLKQKNLGILQYIIKEDGLYSKEGELIFEKSEP